MFVYICIFVLAVLWLGLALIIFYLFGKYSDLIKEYQMLENVYDDVINNIVVVCETNTEILKLLEIFDCKE